MEKTPKKSTAQIFCGCHDRKIKSTYKQFIYTTNLALNISDLYPSLHNFSKPDTESTEFEELAMQEETLKQQERTIEDILDKVKVVGSHHV